MPGLTPTFLPFFYSWKCYCHLFFLLFSNCGTMSDKHGCHERQSLCVKRKGGRMELHHFLFTRHKDRKEVTGSTINTSGGVCAAMP